MDGRARALLSHLRHVHVHKEMAERALAVEVDSEHAFLVHDTVVLTEGPGHGRLADAALSIGNGEHFHRLAVSNAIHAGPSCVVGYVWHSMLCFDAVKRLTARRFRYRDFPNNIPGMKNSAQSISYWDYW